MADLGNIDVEAPRIDTAAIDRANRGVVQGLENLSGIIQQKRQNDILGEAKEDFVSVVQSVDTEAASVAAPEPVQATGNDAADRILTVIRGAEATLAQGKSNLAARADLDLKRALNELQRDHPAYSAKLGEEYGRFVSTDATLDGLGLLDASRNASGVDAMAQRRLAAIEDQGYSSAKNGGYAIPRQYLPNSTEFASLWAQGQEIQQQQEMNLLHQIDRKNMGDLNIDKEAPRYRLELMGKGNAYQRTLRTYADELRGVLSEFQRDRNLQDSDMLFDWVEGGGKDVALANIADAKLELGQHLDNIPLNERQNEQFIALAEIRDNQLLHFGELEEAILKEDVDLLDKWEIQNEMRISEFRMDNPDWDNMLVFVEAAGSALGQDPFKSLVGDDAILSDELSRPFLQYTREAFASIYSASGRATLNPTMAPEERRVQQQVMRDKTEFPFPGKGAVVRMTDEEVATSSQESMNGLALWAADPAAANAVVGTRILDAYGSNVDRLNSKPTQFFEVREDVTDFINTPAVFDLITSMKEGGADSSLVNFVDIVSTQRSKGPADEGKTQVEQGLNATGGTYNLNRGDTVGSMVIADMGRFEKTGKISLTLNTAAIARQPNPLWEGKVLGDAREAIKQWEQEVHALAVLDYARGASDHLDYVKAATDNNYFPLLGLIGEIEGDEELEK